MTVTIRDALAVLPSGDPGEQLSVEELSVYLREQYNSQPEKDRNARHCIRDEIYRDGGVMYMQGIIDHVFEDPRVKQLRKQWVAHTRFNNPLKRVVNELATVYADPAKRTVDDEASNAKYHTVLETISMDEQMLQISRLLNLHRAMLVRFRVRTLPDGSREPALDWCTPSNARAVLHPNDPTLVLGWLIRTSYKTARVSTGLPSWMLWTDHERAQLRDDLTVIPGTYIEHNLGVNPWVGVTLSPPGPGWWPGEEGEDLVAAAVSIWMTSILLLKETKSATKQTVLTGDGTTMARGQALDSEVPVELADGQAATTVDMSMDLDLFRKTADHILEHVAQNYGMSAALINQQGVQSAEARELMRVPLRELRKHQQVPFRRLEFQLAKVMAAVLAKDMSELAFDPSGWRIEFGEAQTPLSRTEQIDLFLKERAAGVDNTVAYIQRLRNCTWDQALDELERNVEVETARNVLMRPMAGQSGGDNGAAPIAANAPDEAADRAQVEGPDPVKGKAPARAAY